MAKMNPVNWFEIPVKDMKRAKRFYDGVFGYKLEVEDYGGMLMAFLPSDEKAAGAAGALVGGKGYRPSKTGTMVYFSVSDIAGTLRKAAARGGKTLTPKTSIGEWGFIANFVDSEGNRVALHSMR